MGVGFGCAKGFWYSWRDAFNPEGLAARGVADLNWEALEDP